MTVDEIHSVVTGPAGANPERLTEIERQRAYVYSVKSQPMPCPVCSLEINAYTAISVATGIEYGSIEVDKVYDNYRCPGCLTDLRYITGWPLGQHHWAIRHDERWNSIVGNIHDLLLEYDQRHSTP